jgi:hypothetical protein
MFSSGRTTRSGSKPFPPIHILMVDPYKKTGWSTYCTGAPAEESTATPRHKTCTKCLSAIKEQDDWQDVLSELGYPWA